MLPEARVVHQNGSRFRMRIESRKGDANFFRKLRSSLSKGFPQTKVNVSAITGSVLFTGDEIDPQTLADFGRETKVFDLTVRVRPTVTAAVVEPIRSASRFLKKTTGGEAGLNETVFLACLVFGIVELVRGNFRTPPWYTAFWYAFGLFTKSLVEKVAEGMEKRP